MKQKITLNINGKTYADEVEPRLLLIHYLREVAGLTGPHIGCETSICGACTVMVDGLAVKSCTMFAVQAEGRAILTIEGLAQNGKLDPLQEAFWNEHALRHGLEGNLCRCTGYQHIVNAVKSAAKAGGV